MPGTRSKKTPPNQTPPDPKDAQAEAFERLSEKLTATFSQGFEKMQEAIVNMAQKTTAQQTEISNQKRQAEPEFAGYDTRNKDLRPFYNPEPVPPQKKSKKKPSKSQPAPAMPADAIDVDHSDVSIPVSTAPCTSVGHGRNVNNFPNPGPSDLNLAMNDWIIGQAAQNKTSSAFNLPTSTAELPNDSSLEAQVQQVLINTASHLAKGNQNTGFYPHRYVVRGPEKKKLGLNSLTILEYLHAILKMIKDSAVPSNSKPYIYAHLEEVIEDARQYDWPTAVRPWSEEVFTLINDGSMPEGWAAQQKIQMLRMTMSRASTARLPGSVIQTQVPQSRPRQNNIPSDNLKGSSPCVDFNSQQGCQLVSGHIVNGRKVVHICAFCLWHSAATYPHPECYCRNRQRYNTASHF